jgi:patatin-like phospholipase/acyl hydrolase
MYRIISLDGGGMHGFATVTLLKRLAERYPSLIENTDLIAGTSIGGIIGLGMALGHSLDLISHNFIRGFPLAFTTNHARLIAFYAGLASKYDNRKFKAFLRTVYGGTKLKDLQKKVLIPTFSIDDESLLHRRWRAKIFHNFEGTDCDGEAKVLDVAMASSAVPVYFPAYEKYIDGALVANNPAFCAVAQTQDKRNQFRPKLDEVVVLSIGTIRDVFITQRNMSWGYLSWIKSILNILTERDTIIINYLCDNFLADRYHRMEPIINGPMDNFEEIVNIKKIGDAHPIEETVEWLKKYWG